MASNEPVAALSAVVLTVSDAALADPSENRAGPVVVQALLAMGLQAGNSVVASDAVSVREALEAAVEAADVVVTCGGSGIRPGDVVVDETLALGLAELPGIAEEIRRRGAGATSASLVSRGVAGVVRRAERQVLVLNAPSSRGGARDAMAVLAEVWPHMVRDLSGGARH